MNSLPRLAGMILVVGGTTFFNVQESRSAHLDTAVVPGADLVLKIDLKSARKAPIYGSMKEAEKGKEAKGSTTASLSKATQELEEKLGLKEEDIESIVISADLDDIAAVGDGSNPLLKSQAVMAVQVSRAVTLDRIKSALTSLTKEEEDAKDLKVSEIKIDGHPALSVASGQESDPPYLISVQDGKTIYLGMNQESIGGAYTRSRSKAAPLDATLAKVMDSIPAASQIKLSFVVPGALKKTLQGMAGGGDGAEPGPGAMLAGFSDIRSIALSLNLGEKAAVNLSGDMGSPEAAQGLNIMLSMFKPQVLASLAQQAGKTPQEMPANALATTLQGQILTIALLLDKELISALSNNK